MLRWVRRSRRQVKNIHIIRLRIALRGLRFLGSNNLVKSETDHVLRI